MKEPLPLATIHDAVLKFLRNRDDAALFGAQAVNAYVDEPRMTQDVDILSTHAANLAEELRQHLATKFHIEVRVRDVSSGLGFRIFQLRQPKNRHLVDVRQVSSLPPTQLIAEIRVTALEELIAPKVISYCARRGQPKSGTDWRDLAVMLLAHPELKSNEGPVRNRLESLGADETVLQEWRALAELDIRPEDEEEFDATN